MSLVSAQDLYVGSNTSGNSTTLSAGVSNYNFVYVGYDSNSMSNTLTITGSGVRLNGTNTYIGYSGSGNSMVLTNVGSAYATSSYIGYSATASNNSVVVVGTDSMWTNAGNVTIGNAGPANHMIVSNGAISDVYNSYIGNSNTSSNNTVTVTGINSYSTNRENLFLGVASSGNSVNIADSARLGIASNLAISVNAGISNNSLNISGASTEVSCKQTVTVGQNGSAVMTILDGAHLLSVNSIISSNTTTSNNFVEVNGTDSLYSNSSIVFSGLAGPSNVMLLTNNGKAIADTTYIGYSNTSSNNLVAIVGASGGTNSFYSNSGTMFVGYDSPHNTMTMSNGGVVKNNDGYIGYTPNSSNNIVNIIGTNSMWTNSGNLYIGNESSGNIVNILNGGALANAGDAFVGGIAGNGSNNAVVLSGNSHWTSPNSIYSGWNSNGVINSGDITISNDGSSIGAGLIYIHNGTITSGDSNSLNSKITLGTRSTPGVLALQSSINITSLEWGTNGSISNVIPGQQIVRVTDGLTNAGGGGVINFAQGLSFNNNINLLLTAADLSNWTNTDFSIRNLTGGMIITNSTSVSHEIVTDANIVANLQINQTNQFTVNEVTLMNNNSNVTNTIANNGAIYAISTIISSNTSLVNYGQLIAYEYFAFSAPNSSSSNITLAIQGGGRVSAALSTVGGNDFEYATNIRATLTGSNSLWSNGVFHFGWQGVSNVLTVSDGATLHNDTAIIGYSTLGEASNNFNSIIVTGTNTEFINGGVLVGEYGNQNSLIISNQATFSAGDLVIGGVGSSNYVSVSGPGTTANIGAVYITGLGSQNSMYISNAANVVITNGMTIGATNGTDSTNGLISVQGSNTIVTNQGYINIGSGGSGHILNISDDAMVYASNITIGVTSGGNLLTVNGASLNITTTNPAGPAPYTFIIGSNSSGNSAIFSNGATGNISLGTLGYNSGASNNSLLVSDTNTILTSTNDFYVGFIGANNSTTISNGGKLLVTGQTQTNIPYGVTYIGLSSSSNSLTITGTNSLSSNQGNIIVGNFGNANVLNINNGGGQIANGFNTTNTNGGIVTTNPAFMIGAFSGFSNNIIYITNGFLQGNGDGVVGSAGSQNYLDIVNGYAINSNGFIGFTNTASNNIAIITGSNSVWTNTENLYIGYQGASGNELILTNGGRVVASNVIVGSPLGTNIASNNSVLVEGTGSYLNVLENLTIGNEGSNNSMTISEGGEVSTLNAYINNTVTVVGTNSRFSSVADMNIGTLSNAGTLIVSNSGAVSATEVIVNNGELIAAGGTISAGVNLAGLSTSAIARLTVSNNITLSSLSSGDNSYVKILPGNAKLTVAGALSGTVVFDFSGWSFSNLTNEFVDYGTSSVVGYSVHGLTGVTLITNGTNVSETIYTNANVTSSIVTYQTNTVEVQNFTFTSNTATNIIDTNGVQIATQNYTITNGATVINSGTITTADFYNYGTFTNNGGTVNSTSGNTIHLGGRTVIGAGLPSTFNGNTVMEARDFLVERAMGNVAPLYGRLIVNGTLQLGGRLGVEFFNGFTPAFGSKLENFIIATGGITGSFESLISLVNVNLLDEEISQNQDLRARLLFRNNNKNIDILFAPASYTEAAQNQNQTNVATALNSFITATTGDQVVVSTALDELSASQYPDAFEMIMPILYQSLSTTAFNLANAQNNELMQRLWSLRVAGTGFTMNGFGENMPLFQEGQGDQEPSKDDILTPGVDKRWGVFVDGNGIFAQANSGNMLPSYNAEAGGVTTGLTYQWNNYFSSGLYTGYEGSYTKFTSIPTGSLTDNAVRFGVFGTLGQPDQKGFYLNGLAGGAYNSYTMERNINFNTINRTATGSPGAGELDTMLITGYDIKRGNFTFGPTTSLQYTYLGVNPFSETGADSLDLNANGWNTSSMIYTLGSQVAYNWQVTKNILITPSISLNWQHEFMQNQYTINSNLNGASPAFANFSTAPQRDSFMSNIGLMTEFYKRWNLSFNYSAIGANQDLRSQNIFLSLGFQF